MHWLIIDLVTIKFNLYKCNFVFKIIITVQIYQYRIKVKLIKFRGFFNFVNENNFLRFCNIRITASLMVRYTLLYLFANNSILFTKDPIPFLLEEIYNPQYKYSTDIYTDINTIHSINTVQIYQYRIKVKLIKFRGFFNFVNENNFLRFCNIRITASLMVRYTLLYLFANNSILFTKDPIPFLLEENIQSIVSNHRHRIVGNLCARASYIKTRPRVEEEEEEKRVGWKGGWNRGGSSVVIWEWRAAQRS